MVAEGKWENLVVVLSWLCGKPTEGKQTLAALTCLHTVHCITHN